MSLPQPLAAIMSDATSVLLTLDRGCSGHHICCGPSGRFVFQGERRFYLGAVVDDLFLSTEVYEFTATNQEGPAVRSNVA